MPVIQAINLHKTFDHFTAVNGVSFVIEQGESVGILGPNGAGKTTTLRMLTGNTIPSAGELKVLDYTIPQDAQQMRHNLGVVPQHDNLDPDFTVLENLETYATYFGFKPRLMKSKFAELLHFAALENKANAKIATLSGGMRRRLIVARALINDPKLLILDEPTTGLDPQARQFIWQRLRMLRQQGTTLILTTHYMEEAQRLCERLLVMEQGKILVQGKPQELIAEHIEPYVFEIHGDEIDVWLAQHKKLTDQRIERVAETIFCYCLDDQSLLQELQNWPSLQVLRRPANLEDVFIKLTGRELRDEF